MKDCDIRRSNVHRCFVAGCQGQVDCLEKKLYVWLLQSVAIVRACENVGNLAMIEMMGADSVSRRGSVFQSLPDF